MNDPSSPFEKPTDPQVPATLKSAVMRLETGQTIGGRYVVRGRIGAGGMGSVFRVHDRELAEDVALKIVSAEHEKNLHIIDRLRREVKLARKIAHPNVCKVFDYGEADGLRFLTMELIEGQSLRSLLSQGSLSLSRVCDMMAQVAAGLSAVHEQGIVHRDIKPENVVIRSNGQSVVVDFGLARTVTPGQNSELVAGTPSYMSPEQLRGEHVDQRSDVFALGVLCYELLTRRTPFEQGSYAATVSAILREPPKPLDLPRLPSAAQVEGVLDKALAKSPDERFANALDFAEALKKTVESPSKLDALSAERTRSPQPSPGRVLAFRKKIGILAAGLLVVAGVTLAITYLDKAFGGGGAAVSSSVAEHHLETKPVIVIAPFRNLTGDPTKDSLALSSAETLRKGLSKLTTIQSLESSHASDPYAVCKERGAAWIITGGVSGAGSRLHVNARFETCSGKVASEETSIELHNDSDQAQSLKQLEIQAVDEARLLLGERERLQRAKEGTQHAEAREKLIRYYEEHYMHVLQGPDHATLRTGKQWLDEAIALDSSYVPALVERAFLRMKDQDGILGPEPLALAQADIDRALSVDPSNPPALVLRCRILRFMLQQGGSSTDRGNEDVKKSCDAALKAAPLSAQAHLEYAKQQEGECNHNAALRSLEWVVQNDHAYLGHALMHLVELVLKTDDLASADKKSLELIRIEEEQPNLNERSVRQRLGLPPIHEAHLIRAGVLIRLKRMSEAHAELKKQIDNVPSGRDGELLKAAVMYGLLFTAPNPTPEDLILYASHLKTLEAEFEAQLGKDPTLAYAIAARYQYVDPKAAIRWIERAKKTNASAPTCDELISLAHFYREASQPEQAREALGACKPVHNWERQCMAWMESRLK